MKVLLVSNWNDQCGNSTYGHNLLRFATSAMQIVPFEIGRPPEELIAAAGHVDIIHINWVEGVARPFNPEAIQFYPKPTVYTNQNNVFYGWYAYLAAVVNHGPDLSDIQRRLPHVRVVDIPHGVVDLDLPPPYPVKLVLAQAGFPFGHKRYDLVCRTALQLAAAREVKVFLIMPQTYRTDPQPLVERCKQVLGDIPAEFITEWLPEDEVIRLLHAKAGVCVHPGGMGVGVSGSVRLSISSLRPVVVNGHAPLFADVVGAEGIYPYYREQDMAATALAAYGQQGANALVKRLSYRETSRLYYRLFSEVLDGAHVGSAD